MDDMESIRTGKSLFRMLFLFILTEILYFCILKREISDDRQTYIVYSGV